MSEQNSSEANVKNGEKSGITIGNVLSPGIGDAFRSIKKSFIPDRKMMGAIVDMKNRLLSSDPEIVLDTESSDPRQRFLDGMEQFGLSEEDLKKKCEQSALMFNIMAIVLAVIVAIIIIEFPGYHAFGSFMIFAMPAFFLIFMLLLVIAKWGFYNWCIRNMKMGKFTQWLASPREWLPSSTLRVAQVMTLLAILAGSFANPGSASAASVDMSSSSSCQSSSSGVMATFTLPCDTDVYKNLLEDMFPSVTPLGEPTIIGSVDRPYTNSNGTSALANAFQAFLSVLMSVAMAMLSWHILVTLVSVAHEGTMLSQRWSVIWAPLRLFLGAGSLAPFVKGYCMAQVLILYVALWGGSMANVMWTAYVQGLTNPMISPSAIPYLTPSLIQIAQQRVCYAALKRAEYVIGGDNYIADIPTSIVEQSAQDEGTSVTDPAAQDHWMITNMVSGFLTGKKTPGSNTAQSNVAGATVHTKRYTWYYGAACGSTTVKVPDGGSLTSFGEKEHQAIASYISTVGTAADRLAAMEITPDSGAQDTTEAKAELRKDIASAYGKAVGDFSDAVNQLSETLNTVGTTDYIQNFKNDASKYGWATAGIYYMNISRMQGMADALIALNPITNNTGTPSDANNDVAKEVKMITQGAPADALSDMATEIANTYQPTGKVSMSQVNSELSAASQAGKINGVTVNLNTIVNDNSDNPVVNAAEKISQWAGSLVSSLANLTGSGATSNASENGESEIQALTEFGNNMITLAYMAIMAIFVGKVAGSLFSVLYKARKFIKMGMILTGIGEAATGVGAGVGAAQIALATIGDVFGSLIEKAGALAASWIVSILTFLLTVGVVHAYILPMMPFIHFTLFVLSMLIFVVEAMIAAPLWAFVHIKLNGQELIDGEQKMGYQLAFNLFLRAPLGMLGFFLSFAIFDAMMYFLRLTFYPAAVASTSNSTGLIGTCVMIAMMSYLHFTLAMRSFSLISEIPDRVSRWFGGPSVGSEHGHAEGAKSFMAGMVARGIANQAGGAMSGKHGGGGGGGGQPGGGKTISRSRTQLGKGLDHLPSKSQSVSAERASSMRSASGSMAEGIMGDLEQGGMNISSSQHLREGLESAIHDVATGIEKQSLGNGDSIMDSLRNTINDHSSTQNMSRGDKEKIVQSLNTKLRQNIGHLAQ